MSNSQMKTVSSRFSIYFIAISSVIILFHISDLHNFRAPCPCNIKKDRFTTFTDNIIDKSEAAIVKLIEKVWKLTNDFQYLLTYVKTENDGCSLIYWFEVVFGKPTLKYPVPQVTCLVTFRVNKSLIAPCDLPIEMFFQLENSRDWHNVRKEDLSLSAIVCVLKQKMALFQRIEDLAIF